MLNQLRMDLYRMLRSTSYYVCIGILLLGTLLSYGLAYLMANPDWLQMAAEKGMAIGELAKEPSLDQFTNMSFLELFHSTNISGGMLPVVTGILLALYVCTEFDHGFIKNIMSAYRNRWSYLLSKTISQSLVNLAFLLITFFFTMLLNLITGSPFVNSSPTDTLFYLLSVWMICNGFSALVLLICMVTRSKAAGTTGALLFCSGMVTMLLRGILSLMGFQDIMNYSLYWNLSSCPLSYHQASDYTGLIMGIIFTLVYTLISGYITCRKDAA